MQQVEFGKTYTHTKLKQIFNLESRSIKRNIDKIKKEYLIRQLPSGRYIIDRELTELEKIENAKIMSHKKFIEPMICLILMKENTNRVKISMSELLYNLSMINNNFYYVKYNSDKVEELLESELFQKNIAKSFIWETEPMLKKIVKEVLKEMEDAQLIEIRKIKIYAKKEYNKGLKKFVTKTWERNDDEIEVFLTKSKEVLKKLSVDKYSSLTDEEYENVDIPYSQMSLYKKELSNKLGIDYFFNVYDISLSRKNISERYKKIKLAEIKNSYNNIIVGKLSKSNQGQLKNFNNLEKIMCTDLLIKNNCENLKEKVNNKETNENESTK